MSLDFDYCIVGGGVVGLAAAWYLSRHGQVLLIEKNALFGAETSSRNSEVIHAGLYYPEGSLKERLCLRGKELLYQFCSDYSVPHKAIGKLIIAPQAGHPKLLQLQQKAARLGIPLQKLNRHELAAREPTITGKEALFSPTTGIIDSHSYMQSLASEAGRHGAMLLCHTRFISAQAKNDYWTIETATSDGPFSISAGALINAAGLHAQQVAHAIEPRYKGIPPLFPCRGHYFIYSGSQHFSHLIYPLPEANLAGLGIHATLDLGGQVRFGPDTQYLSPGVIDDYSVSISLREKFKTAIKRYFPSIRDEDLQPAYAGIRPKLQGEGSKTEDFVITLTQKRPAAIQLFGIESPGLTSSLAIGELITEMLKQ